MKSFINSVSNNVKASFIVGALLLIFAVVSYFVTATNYDSLTAVADDGVISSVETSTTRRRGKTTKKYRAYVTFTDSDHRAHKVRSIVNTKSSSRYKVGQHVSVHYDPWNPEGGCLIVGDEGLVEGNLVMMILLVVGAAGCFIVPILFSLVKRRSTQRA